MNVTREQAETAVAESPTSRTVNTCVRRVSEPYPHSAPTPRSTMRNAEFLKRLSAKNLRARLSTPPSRQSFSHHRSQHTWGARLRWRDRIARPGGRRKPAPAAGEVV